jgi:hypothetical protein
MALTDNLLAFYKLSDLTDSSGNNRTLTNNGNVSFASGKIGNAAVFDGSSNYFSVDNFPAFGTGDFTVQAWYYTDSTNMYPAALEFGNHQNADSIGFFLANSGEYRLKPFIYSAAFFDPTTTPDISIGQWNHVVWKRTNSMFKIFVNGVASEEIEFSNEIVTPFQTSIGYAKGADGGGDYYVNGSIDAVGIWNRALSDAEVAELYNNGTGLELDGVVQPTLVKMQAPVKFFGKIKFGV